MIPYEAARRALRQVPVGLKPHPELGRGLQESRQAHRSVRRDSALAEHNFAEAVPGDAEVLRGLRSPKAKKLEELLKEHLAGGDSRAAQLGTLRTTFDSAFTAWPPTSEARLDAARSCEPHGCADHGTLSVSRSRLPEGLRREPERRSEIRDMARPIPAMS